MLIDTGQVSCRRVDDPRVRQLVRATDNPGLFPDLKIPKSTIRGCHAITVAGLTIIRAERQTVIPWTERPQHSFLGLQLGPLLAAGIGSELLSQARFSIAREPLDFNRVRSDQMINLRTSWVTDLF